MYNVVTILEDGHEIEIGMGDTLIAGRIAECTFRLANPTPAGIDALIRVYEHNLGKLHLHTERQSRGRWEAASDMDKRGFLERTGGHGVLWQIVPEPVNASETTEPA